MSMTPEAKRQLSSTIRGLRARLLDDLHASTEQAYRLSARTRDAGLSEAARIRRRRLEAWLTEQVRAQDSTRQPRSAADFRLEVEKQAAYTLLNRVVLLRLMEAADLRSPAVVSGGWESSAYKALRELAPALARAGDTKRPEERDETEGYAFLLRLVFEDLAVELSGLFGPAGVAELVPVPAATLRHVVEALGSAELESCWTDDMALGWVYQYWNDPEREALDEKLHGRGKLEPHEIASKTQMFTERYMVDWLLQNSLGPMWLAMCKRHGWTAEVERPGPDGAPSVLDVLEARRVDWRGRRDRGEVTLTDLMPLHSDVEHHWAYYVPQPLPDDAVESAPTSVRDLKLLDPAVGSGHFLVVALGLLLALYREEARHLGQANDPRWSDRAIVERILNHNLHGIDLDPRAIQIAAAALWLKARQLAPDARPERLNLVASNLRLASLPDDDPALAELRREVDRETGLPAALTDRIVHALRGADHLGSLLKVDTAVDEALSAHEAELGRLVATQSDLFEAALRPERVPVARERARATLLDRLEVFLACHSSGDDLGLRLRGEQLAAGVRFVRLLREGGYDLVVGNPPYQGTSKMRDAGYVQAQYRGGRADLYAAFLERGLQLARSGGTSALLTMRSWMFIKQYAELRASLLNSCDLRALGDFDRGAFQEVPDEIVSVVVSVFRRANPSGRLSAALQPTALADRRRDAERTARKRAATVAGLGRFLFTPAELRAVPEQPLLYWWPTSDLRDYQGAPLLGSRCPARFGVNTGNNVRFLRKYWEVAPRAVPSVPLEAPEIPSDAPWQRYLKGAAGLAWLDPCDDIGRWLHHGLEMKAYAELLYGSYSRQIRNESAFFQPGVAFTMLGNEFAARVHGWKCIIDSKGSSVYPADPGATVCEMNRTAARRVLNDLNPSLSFQVGDVNRLPLFAVSDAKVIFAQLRTAFLAHEACRELSVGYSRPGPTAWRAAQVWAQAAVDRSTGAPLPPFTPARDAEPATDHLSFALGVALGRFGSEGEGIRDTRPVSEGGHDLSFALPDGVLFLDGSLSASDRRDSLGHAAAERLHAAWSELRDRINTTRKEARDYLRLDFFKDVHRTMYENRPIHWPLSSSERTFVAWVTIHRWNAKTLTTLLADHLGPAMTRLDGELQGLRDARQGKDSKAARKAEERFSKVQKWHAELTAFIGNVEACAEHGPPPTDSSPKACPPRERDARYEPNLDDGVMINSAALWPLLEPQWKDPKKWWKELAAADKKDYDWSHLAMCYWPKRVDDKCKKDPSLGVAHGCFWRYHPARAWTWELRLQDEIGPDFRIDEAPYRPGGQDVGDPGSADHRADWLREHAEEALAAVEKEAVRRMGRGEARKVVSEMRILEPGLWSGLPADVWAMELRLSERQGAELRLLSPDEPAARAKYAKAHPAEVADRAQRIANLTPPTELFDDDAEASDDDDALSEDDEDDDA